MASLCGHSPLPDCLDCLVAGCIEGIECQQADPQWSYLQILVRNMVHEQQKCGALCEREGQARNEMSG